MHTLFYLLHISAVETIQQVLETKKKSTVTSKLVQWSIQLTLFHVLHISSKLVGVLQSCRIETCPIGPPDDGLQKFINIIIVCYIFPIVWVYTRVLASEG